MHHHPSRDQLAAFARGRLTGPDSGEIESHLEECKSCVALLDHLSEDEFLNALRDAARPAQKCAPTAPAQAPTVRAPDETLSHCDAPAVLPENAVLNAAELPGHPQYRIVGLLGRGGMGVVYRAEEPSVGREVAVKVLRDCYRSEPTAGRRFLAEAGVTARLQHPGIPPVFQVGTLPDGSPFLAMKLVAGRTLSELLAAPVRPTTSELVSTFEHACHAVGYAHSRGVIHRDLKPSNVMVGAFGEVQVMDWGLSKELRNADRGAQNPTNEPDLTSPTPEVRGSYIARTHAGAVMGTPAYMAPEQARGEVDSVDRRSDVFGLGAVLCEILTGAPPFTGADTATVLRMAAAGAIEPAQGRLDACLEDPEPVALCKRCLAPTRDERPADAAAVARALADLRTAAGERARRAELDRVKAHAEARAQRNRRRVQFALAASLCALCVGSFLAGLWQEREGDRRRTEAEHRADRNADALDAVLTDCASALRAGDTDRAAVALNDAERRAPEPGGERYQDRLAQCRADLAVLRELRAFDLFCWTPSKVELTRQAVVDRARAVFASFGMDPDRVAPAEAAGRINASAVRERLLRALDLRLASEWGLEGRTNWTREVLRLTDPDRFRDAVRDVFASENRTPADVIALAERAEAEAQPARFSTALAERAVIPATRRRELLQAALFREPGDLGLLVGIANTYPFDDPKAADERARWFQAAVAVAPWNAGTHYYLGLALRLKGDSVGAEACVREASRRIPAEAECHRTLGLILHERKDFAGAANAYREAIRLQPAEAELHHDLAATLNAKGDLAGVIAAMRESIRLNPRDATARYRLGASLAAKGDVDEAIAEYRESIRLNPKFVDARMHLAAAWNRKTKVDEEIETYGEVIRLDPKNALAHTNLGCALATRGDLEEAIKACQKALTHDPKYALAHYNLGMVLDMGGDADGALRCYREAIKHDPTYAPAHNNLGGILSRRGEAESALKCLREALKHDPTCVPAYNNLGTLLAGIGEFDEAAVAYQSALRLDPKCVAAHYLLGIVQYERGDLDGALACFRSALNLDPGLAPHIRPNITSVEFLTTLRARLPGFSTGRDEPANFEERLGLGYLYSRPTQRKYVDSVVLFRRAFADDPGSVAACRYKAACAAVQAAAGRDAEPVRLSIDEWGILIDQAHSWLRADIEALRLQREDVKNWPAVRGTVSMLKADPALKTVRAQEYLYAMPDPDRKRWEAFWADVDELLSPIPLAPPPREKVVR